MHPARSCSELSMYRVMEPCGEEARRYPPSATAGCQDMVSDTFSSWAMERFKGFNGMAPNLTTIPGNLVTVSKQDKTPNEPEKWSKRYSSIFVSRIKGNIILLRASLLSCVPFTTIILFPARGRKIAQYRNRGSGGRSMERRPSAIEMHGARC